MDEKRFLELIIHSLPYPFYVINVADRTIALANPAARLAKLTRGSTCHALLHGRETPCEDPDHPCPVRIVLETGKACTVEHQHVQPDGSSRTFELTGVPLFDDEGRVVQMVEYATDITDRRRMEADREKLVEELRHALSEVKRLSGLLPICSYCKKVRDDGGYWRQIESYIAERSEADFSHSICPECMVKNFPKTAK
jgi:hypothetical protein